MFGSAVGTRNISHHSLNGGWCFDNCRLNAYFVVANKYGLTSKSLCSTRISFKILAVHDDDTKLFEIFIQRARFVFVSPLWIQINVVRSQFGCIAINCCHPFFNKQHLKNNFFSTLIRPCQVLEKMHGILLRIRQTVDVVEFPQNLRLV